MQWFCPPPPIAKSIIMLALFCATAFAQQNSFTDARDKQKYKTVAIGKQTWMAENLKYNENGSKCIDNKNCSKYGRVYDLATAKKACPAGWHLPSDKEWQELIDFAGGAVAATKKLKAKSDWPNKGTDDLGFSALPGGYLDDEERPNEVDFEGHWWGATSEETWTIFDEMSRYDLAYMASVRCVTEGQAEEKTPPTPPELPKKEAIETEEEVVTAAVEEKEEEEKPVAKPEKKSPKKPKKAKKEEEEEEKDYGEKKYGIRVAYNRATTLYDGGNSGSGHGLEAGALAIIPLSNSFAFSVGANLIYRTPETGEFNSVTRELHESALSLPILIRYNTSLGSRIFYVEAGAQIDLPFGTELKVISNGEESYNKCPWRNSYDLGFALGLGWHINDNFVLDVRGVRGLSEFSKEQAGILLVQGSMGLNYLF